MRSLYRTEMFIRFIDRAIGTFIRAIPTESIRRQTQRQPWSVHNQMM